jgi:hypothetical protein
MEHEKKQLDEDFLAQLKREWDGDPEIQAEFMDFEIFSAYRRAEAAGRVRILTPRVRGPGADDV